MQLDGSDQSSDLKFRTRLRLTSFKNGPRFGNHDFAKVWGKISQARSRVDSDSCLGTSRGKTSLIFGKTHRQKLLHEKLESV
jgi:hypothetical protein